MIQLIGTDGTQYYSWMLSPGKYLLGRSSECDFVVPDKTVSRKHVEIEFGADQTTFHLTDLESHNGTFVNGKKLTGRIQINPGDHLLFGQVQFKLTSGSTGSSESTGLPRAILPENIAEHSVFLSMNEALKPLPSRVSDLPELLPTLFDMAKTLVLPEPQEEMLTRALGLVAKVIPSERLAVLFTSEDRNEIYAAATLLPNGRDLGTFTLSRTIVREILTNKSAILIGDPTSDPRFASQQSVIMSAMKSAMAVPMMDQDRVLGILYVDTTNPVHRYSDEYLRLLATFGNIIAARLMNYQLLAARQEKQLIEAELHRAASIQKNLLIKTPPELAGFDVHAFQRQSRLVGGDLYDVATLPDGRLIFLVADVSGKGLGAALLMSNILASFRITYSAPKFSLEKAVKAISTQLHRYSAPEDFATLFAGTIAPDSGTVSFVNAGHNPPLVVRADGTIEYLEPSGTMIGAFDFSTWKEETVQLAPGEFIFIFSDGVTEAMRGDEPYTDARMEQMVLANRAETPSVIARRLTEDIEAYVGDGPRSDDITMMLVKRI
ncbi:MAG: SpoIIE family protein phosphatase [candidate division Zixibacteria bacterium]|nr:SpoIIE family protein phosphatase [candidate division Zixibacteria bacterium]